MTPDLKTLRSVAEGATPGPWVAGTVPRPHAWDRAFVRVVTDLPDGGRITVYPAACESTTLDNAANAAFIAAANPQAILSLLDRVEALEERDDLAMQIISENAKLRREAEAMAETVRTLEAERDRLRRVVNAAWGAFTDADEVGTPLWEALEKEGFVVCREATKADAAEAFAYERGIYPGGRIIELTPAGRAALHPEPLGEGGGL